MTSVSKARERQTVVSDSEFNEVLAKASLTKEDFYRLRNLAVLCLLRITGKRREEIGMVLLNDVKVESGYVQVRFKVQKKRRKFKMCPKCEPIDKTKARNTANALFCKNCGIDLKNVQRQTKAKFEFSNKDIPLEDPLCLHILNWLQYVSSLTPRPEYFFPRTESLFGKSYVVLTDQHITGRQVFNIVRSTSQKIWPHLYRETAAADVIRQDSSIFGAFKVKDRLDLESEQTGFLYLNRYAHDVIRREQANEREQT